MPFFVSGVATYSAIGLIEGFFETWMIAWFRSSIVALPVILIVAPLTRKLVNKLTLDGTSFVARKRLRFSRRVNLANKILSDFGGVLD